MSDPLRILFEQDENSSVPDTDIEDGVQADISSTGKVILVLAHLDGVQPIIHSAHTELWGGWVLPAEMESTLTISCSCGYNVQTNKYASQGSEYTSKKNQFLGKFVYYIRVIIYLFMSEMICYSSYIHEKNF